MLTSSTSKSMMSQSILLKMIWLMFNISGIINFQKNKHGQFIVRKG